MKNKFVFAWISILIVLSTGLLFPYLQGTDATEYASIAAQMYYRNDWVNIINHGGQANVYDYLDKPHVLFWSAMLGYKIFGVSAFSYRIISVLFTLGGGYATYRLGKILYTETTGKIAAIVFIASQAILMNNHDVKTDTLLVAFAVFAVWHFVAFVQEHRLSNMIWGAAFLAGGVGTKGMIAVIVVSCLIFFYLLGRKDFSAFFTWKWFIGLLSFFVFLSPVLYCYYLQFDLHPEKLVNGSYGNSGIKFLLWSQSFERFAGGRNFRMHPEFIFLFHTFLWTFLPWSLLAYYGTFYRIKELFTTRGASFFRREQLTFTGVWVMFIIMSLSKFKLPHYINILFPFFAIFIAGFLGQLITEKKERTLLVLSKFQGGIVCLCLTGVLLVNVWALRPQTWWIFALACLGIAYLAVQLRKKSGLVDKIWFPSALAILLLNFTLNTCLYSRLQAGISMVSAMKKAGVDPAGVYNYEVIVHPFDFYSRQWRPVLTDAEILQKKQKGEEVLLYTDTYRKRKLDLSFKSQVLISIPNFSISSSTFTEQFISPKTKKDNALLLRIK